MSVKLNSGWERTSRVRLPEGKTKLDSTKPLQAAVTGSLIRIAQNATDMEEVGNLLTLCGSVETIDGNKQNASVKIGTEESYEVTDGKTTQTVSDSNAFNSLLSNGWKLVKIHVVDIMS